ncbi:hypothetical protein F4820DRAFT_461689 [Hypoxylon rubiginosum]|uniref:Uncharacterized protein n=1 Tax=Hypoxylon rubiginosum TaxID=110542 RepID=A0ACB9YMZ3_9PEZI|nr:hypothetical protein F4820DRAFT_461689 [Hypoxylon rubiginosum]
MLGGSREDYVRTVCGMYDSLVKLFVRQIRALGDNVIATGRNASTKLSHLKETGASILDLDVSAPPNVIEAKLAEAWTLYPGGIDVVVNNAGYILSGAVEELTNQEMEDIFRTNVHGPLNVTRAILPKLRAKGKGTLLYISSQAAWHADPGAAGYCASKFALEGAVECLALELAIFAPGIKVLIVEPGYFRTRAFANINHVPPRIPAYAEFNTSILLFPGDAEKAVSIMVALVKGTGVAAGKEIPLRVPLGSDGWARVRTKCQNMIKICDEWEAVAKSTDIE